MLYLAIENDHVVAKKGDTTAIVITVADITKLAEGDAVGVYCASSIDFPEDSTTNEQTIALCREIRK